MMHRGLAWTALLALAILAPGATARGQFMYPGGFGGWGGWGGETAFGADARGMGVFAAGMGAYNLDTSQARAINVDTNMRVNEYIWESQQIRNRQYWARQAERRQTITEGAQQRFEQLRNNPSARDVRNGDALNVVLDEVTDPKVYIDSLKAAQTPLPATTVKSIPFQYAPQAITLSLKEMTRAGVPEVLRTNKDIEAERAAVRAIWDKADKEVEEDGQVSPETLREAQAALKAARDKVLRVIPAGPQRLEADNFLKGLYALTKMLEVPQFDMFLRQLNDESTTTLGHLITFMNSFNLRFGVAQTPAQQATYTQLFPMLVALRNQVNPQGSDPMSADLSPEDHAKALQAFSNLEFEHFEPQPPVKFDGSTPPPPAPGTPE